MKIFASKADAVDHVKKKTCFINVISRGGVNDGTTSDEEELFDIHDKNNAAVLKLLNANRPVSYFLKKTATTCSINITMQVDL